MSKLKTKHVVKNVEQNAEYKFNIILKNRNVLQRHCFKNRGSQFQIFFLLLGALLIKAFNGLGCFEPHFTGFENFLELSR